MTKMICTAAIYTDRKYANMYEGLDSPNKRYVTYFENTDITA
jgi:hypothetical protein